LPREGLLHYSLHAWTVPADGLRAEEDPEYSLNLRFMA
jgi:hypothetical protein